MVINPRKKFIFVHIPKVAGISITNSLNGKTGIFSIKDISDNVGLIGTHAYANELKNFIGHQIYNKFYSFAFVRNPWDRLYSLYNFMCKSSLIKDIQNTFDQEQLQANGFKWFLMDYKVNTTLVKIDYTIRASSYVNQTITPQINWITDKNGKIIVDYIGKYENLNEDFQNISSTLKINTQLPHNNKNTVDDYRKQYDNEMIEFVEHYHKIDIDTFKYNFE